MTVRGGQGSCTEHFTLKRSDWRRMPEEGAQGEKGQEVLSWVGMRKACG